jgi:hypothetical protein
MAQALSPSPLREATVPSQAVPARRVDPAGTLLLQALAYVASPEAAFRCHPS